MDGLFRFSSALNLNKCLPCFLLSRLHDLVKPSSQWAVTISSQSLALPVECDIAIIGGNFSDAIGVESVEAFFINDP